MVLNMVISCYQVIGSNDNDKYLQVTMKIIFQTGTYIRFCPGDPTVPLVIDVPHGSGGSQEADENTIELSHDIAKRTGCGVIQCLIPRTVADLNRPINFQNVISIAAHNEQREALRSILHFKNALNATNEVSGKFLYISLHGMKNVRDENGNFIDIEVGTRYGELCDKSTCELIRKCFTNMFALNVVVDQRFIGSECLAFHIYGDLNVDSYFGYSHNLQIVQLELSNIMRFENYEISVAAITLLVKRFKLDEVVNGQI